MLAHSRIRNPMKDSRQRVYLEGLLVAREPERNSITVDRKSRPPRLST